MLTFKQLEALQQWVATGSIAGAAEKLFTTESALSKRLQELERTLGVAVFDRSGRALSLTGTGEVVLAMTQQLLAQRDALMDISRTPRFEGRRFRLGMTEFIASGWLTQLLEGVRQRYDRVDLEPRIGLSFDLVRDLSANELDVVIVPKSAVSPELVTRPLFVSSNVWVGAPALVQGVDVLDPEQLRNYSLILQPRNSALDTSVRRWFEDNHTALPRIISCNSLAGVKSLAIAGFGVVPLPLAYCRAEIEAGRLKPLEVRPALTERVYCAVRKPGPEQGLAALMSAVVEDILTGSQ